MKKILWFGLSCLLCCVLGFGLLACSLRSHEPTEAAATLGMASAAATATSAAVASPAPATPAGNGSGDSASTSSAAAAGFSGLSIDRRVIRDAAVQLTHDDPVTTTEEATRIAVNLGGFVLDGHVESAGGHTLSSKVTLRLPESAFEKALEGMRALGVMREETITGQDVTEELVDTESRVRALRVLHARMLALLERTAGLSDLLQVEQELARVGGEIERYEGRLRFLKERTEMASIELTVFGPELPQPVYEPETVASRLKDAFRRSTHLSVDVLEGGIVLLGFVLPASVLGGIAMWPLIWFRRRRRLLTQTQAVSPY